MNKWFVKKRRLAAIVLAAGAVVALTATAVAQSQRFPDVPPDHYAYEAVEWAAEVGVTTGYGDGTFKPEEPLIRRHARVFLERFYDDVLGANGDDEFKKDDFTRADMMVLLKAIDDGTIRDTTVESDAAPTGSSTLFANANRSCFLSSTGALSCWGEGTTASPGGAGRYIDVSLNSSSTRARCAPTALWSAGATANTGAPTPHRVEFSKPSPRAKIHTCALRTSGELECWGDNTDGRSTPPTGTYKAVTSGYESLMRDPLRQRARVLGRPPVRDRHHRQAARSKLLQPAI